MTVWAELGMDKDGQHYAGTMRYVKVYPFGSEPNPEELGHFDILSAPFKAGPVSNESALGDAVDEAIRRVRNLQGLASYRKADYEAALRIFSSLGCETCEYYAGRACFLKAISAAPSRQLLESAESHLLKAISFDNHKDWEKAIYYEALGILHNYLFTSKLSWDPRREADKAISSYDKSIEIFKSLNDLDKYFHVYSYVLLLKAKTLYAMHSLDTAGATKVLDESEKLLNEALLHFEAESWQYGSAMNLLGAIHSTRNEYQQAIVAHQAALKCATAPNTDVSATRRLLGEAQANYAIEERDANLYEAGIRNFDQASQHCKQGSIDLECYDSHIDAGGASTRWARLWQRGSLPWSNALQHAIVEYKQSVRFVSDSAQEELYADAKRQLGEAYSELAIGAPTDEEHLGFLKAALDEFMAGIKVLSAANRDFTLLQSDRAHCYEQLSVYTGDPAEKNEYRKLARQDRKAATKKRSKKPPVA